MSDGDRLPHSLELSFNSQTETHLAEGKSNLSLGQSVCDHYECILSHSSSQTCPICLENVSSDLAFTDSCYHYFCLFCILQWAELQKSIDRELDPQIKVLCPLCRTGFHSLLVNPDPKHQTFKRLWLLQQDNVHWSQAYKLKNIQPSLEIQRKELGFFQRRIVYLSNRRPLLQVIREEFTPSCHLHQCISMKNDCDALNHWLEREIAVLLHHETMPISLISLQEQEQETCILLQLIKRLSKQYKDELETLFLTDEHGETSHQCSSSMEKQLNGFFRENTKKFIRELSIFLCSSYDVHTFDQRIIYQEEDE